MKKLKISIIDLIHNSPSQSLYRRAMFSNYISIMPQIIGVWCREEGHEVSYSIFTGSQKLKDLLSVSVDKCNVLPDPGYFPDYVFDTFGRNVDPGL